MAGAAGGGDRSAPQARQQARDHLTEGRDPAIVTSNCGTATGRRRRQLRPVGDGGSLNTHFPGHTAPGRRDRTKASERSGSHRVYR